jgi:2-aminoethylphosphonate-pyruvate transaminase
MQRLGFKLLIDKELRSPIITSFLYPADNKFAFKSFYDALKQKRFVIYPGKVSNAETFRIGTIGHLFPEDIRLLVKSIGEVVNEMQLTIA